MAVMFSGAKAGGGAVLGRQGRPPKGLSAQGRKNFRSLSLQYGNSDMAGKRRLTQRWKTEFTKRGERKKVLRNRRNRG